MSAADTSAPATGASSIHHLTFGSICILLLFGFSLLLINAHGWVLTRHEVLAAEPAREMLDTGDWILPRIGGVLRTAKPPTTSWLIAASMKLFQSENEVVARLPAILSGVITALLVASLARRFYSQRIAVVAGLVQLTSFYTLMQSRLAEADMPLCAAITGALWALAFGAIDTSSSPRDFRTYSYAFYFFSAMAFLLKGIVGPVFIILTVGSFLLVRRERRLFRFVLTPIGVGLFIFISASWPVIAYLHYPAIWDIWWNEQIGRSMGEMGSHGRQPLLYYFWNVPLLLLPWIFFLIPAGIAAYRRKDYLTTIAQFFVCWFVPGFVLLSAIIFKHKHYAIPLLPPFSIAMAAGMFEYMKRQHSLARPHHGLVAIILLIACAIGGILPWFCFRLLAAPISAMAAIVAVGGLCIIWMEHQKRQMSQLAALFATTWLIIIVGSQWILPRFDGYRESAELGRRASQSIPPDAPIYILDLGETQISYYLRLPIVRIDRSREFLPRLAEQPGTKYVVASADAANLLERIGRVEMLDQVPSLRRNETESDRPIFLRLTVASPEMPRSSSHPSQTPPSATAPLAQ